MLNTLFGWYVQESLKGKYISIIFRTSLEPDEEDTLTLDDAEDAAKLKSWLTGDNFILTDVSAFSTPGTVQLTVLPDSDSTKQFKFDATNTPITTPIMPPKLVEVSLEIDYINESQPNDLYIIISALRISEDNTAKFTLLSELIPVSIENVDLQTLGAQKLLYNMYYQNNAIMQQNNIMILQLNALLKASGGIPLEIPATIVMPANIYFPDDITQLPDYYLPPIPPIEEEVERKAFCKRR